MKKHEKEKSSEAIPSKAPSQEGKAEKQKASDTASSKAPSQEGKADKKKRDGGFFNKLKQKLKHGDNKKGKVVDAQKEGQVDSDEEPEDIPLSKKEQEKLKKEAEERRKFFEDIGYVENAAPVTYPREVCTIS